MRNNPVRAPLSHLSLHLLLGLGLQLLAVCSHPLIRAARPPGSSRIQPHASRVPLVQPLKLSLDLVPAQEMASGLAWAGEVSCHHLKVMKDRLSPLPSDGLRGYLAAPRATLGHE